MNNTEIRLYKVTNDFIPKEKITLSKKELDEYFRKCIILFEDEIEEIDTEAVREELYFVWRSYCSDEQRAEYEQIVKERCGIKEEKPQTKHKLNEIWEEKEGSKKVWKLQAPKGILTFSTRGKAIAFSNSLNGLVPMPVNLKAQKEYNKRFGTNIHFEEE